MRFYIFILLGLDGAIVCRQKNFALVRRCHQLLPGFLAKSNFPWVSRQSDNGKDDNEVKLGVVQRSPGIRLTAEEIPGNSQLGDSMIEGVPYLKMRSIGSQSTSGMEKEGKKERTGIDSILKFG